MDFDICERPRLAALDEARIWPKAPLGSAHRAAVAALACLSCAVEQLGNVLRLWRDRFAEDGTRLHLDGHAGTNAWTDAIAAIRSKPLDFAAETKAYADAGRWVDSAEDWLNLWSHAEVAESSAERLARDTADGVRAQHREARSNAAREGAKENIKVLENRRRVAAIWRRLQPDQRGAGAVGLICQQLDPPLTAPSVRAHLRKLGLIPASKEKRK